MSPLVSPPRLPAGVFSASDFSLPRKVLAPASFSSSGWGRSNWITTSGQPSTFNSLRLAPRCNCRAVTCRNISWACGSLPVTSTTIASAALPGAGAIKPMPASPPGTPFRSSRVTPSRSWMLDQRSSI